MTTLLLLCSLLLAALGLTAGAFALHAYVGDYLGDQRGPGTPMHAASAAPLLMRPRAHFVVLDPPARPGAPHTAAAMAPKAKGHEKPSAADARHAQKAAAPAPSWPWNLFQ
jgi:hypothetical protein